MSISQLRGMCSCFFVFSLICWKRLVKSGALCAVHAERLSPEQRNARSTQTTRVRQAQALPNWNYTSFFVTQFLFRIVWLAR